MVPNELNEAISGIFVIIMSLITEVPPEGIVEVRKVSLIQCKRAFVCLGVILLFDTIAGSCIIGDMIQFDQI